MTAELLETTSNLSAVEQQSLTAVRERFDPKLDTNDQLLSKESKSVLKRYVENGLDVAKKAPSRVEMIAQAIVYEAQTMTWQKAARLGKDAAINYVKSMDPRRLMEADRYFRYGFGIGAGLSFIFSATGLGFIPGNGLVRTGIGLGVVYGLAGLTEIEGAIKKAQIEKKYADDEAKKAEELAKLADIKASYTAQLKSAGEGLKMGGKYLAAGKLAEHAFEHILAPILEAPAQKLIEEGSKLIDWTKAQVGAMLTPQTAYAAELDPVAAAPVAVPVDAAAARVVGVPMAVADEYTILPEPPKLVDGLELAAKPLTFDQEDLLGKLKDSPSLRGLIKARIFESDSHYQIGDVKDGVTYFDPKDGLQVEASLAIADNDPDYEDKVKAGMNFFAHINQDQAESFSPDGEMLARFYVDQDGVKHLVQYQNLSFKGWKDFYDSGSWKKWANLDGSPVQDENYADQNYQWSTMEISQDQDPILGELDRAEVGLPDDSYLEPGQLKSGWGMGQAFVAEDFYGVEDSTGHFNALDQEQIDQFLQAEANDPLYKYREYLINHQLHADSAESFLATPDNEDYTDYLISTQPDGTPTSLVRFKNYHQLLTGLVNDQSASGAFDGEDAWKRYVPTNLKEIVNIGDETGFKMLAEDIYQDYNLSEVAGDDEEKKAQIVKALVRYLKDNHAEVLLEGKTSSVKLPKEQIMAKIMSFVA